jgi:hypothetical protein
LAKLDDDLYKAETQKQNLLADKVSIASLLIVQNLKVLLNLEPNDRRRLVGEVVDQLVRVHGDDGGGKSMKALTVERLCEVRNWPSR